MPLPQVKSRRFVFSRHFLFRLLAILLGFAAIVLVEGLLRLTDWGEAADFGDPFVAFAEVKPLFVLSERGDRYEIPASRQAFFQPDSFAATKDDAEFRIFCLGGSTVQGRPYSTETSFTAWLQLSLTAADPSRDWEVVNCGGVSYASFRLLPILQEVLTHDPDLLVIYTGHNEFLEDRTYPQIERRPAWWKQIHHRLTGLRIYGLMWQLRFSIQPQSADQQAVSKTTLSAEVDALLDYRGGLEKYHRDDTWRDGVIEHFELNLRRIVRLADEADVPMVIVNPVSNLRDSPPFKTTNQQSLTEQQRDAFGDHWKEAKALEWTHLDKKVEHLKSALAIDDRYADAHFLLGRVYDAIGKVNEAKAEYIRAKDEDICPLRMLERMHEITLQVAKQTNTPLLDARQLFEGRAAGGIPGDDELIDHVHPRIEGHQWIAEELLKEMIRQGRVRPLSGWREQQKALYADRWRTLPPNYFPESVERLRGLRRWSQGRSFRLHPESP